MTLEDKGGELCNQDTALKTEIGHSLAEAIRSAGLLSVEASATRLR